MPVPSHARPSRRTVLRGAGLAALAAATAGCGVDLGDVRWGEDPPPPLPTPDLDELARRRAVVSAQALAAGVATARAARADLDVLLGVLEAEHTAHLAALGPLPPSPSTDTSTGTPTPTDPAPTDPAPSEPVPSDPLADLVVAELAGAGEALTDATGDGGAAVSAGLARLLASVGAARVVHATLLAGVLGQPAPAAPVVGSLDGTQSPDVGDDGAAEAVAAALDGEHAAVYTYGVVAARLAGGERDRALASLDDHRLLVERLSTWLLDAGLEAAPSAPAYTVPPLSTPRDAVVLAASLEDQVAVLDASLVAASWRALRAEAANLLVRRALAAAAWRGTGTAFPGLPELA